MTNKSDWIFLTEGQAQLVLLMKPGNILLATKIARFTVAVQIGIAYDLCSHGLFATADEYLAMLIEDTGLEAFLSNLAAVKTMLENEKAETAEFTTLLSHHNVSF